MGNDLRKLQGKRILAGILAVVMVLTSVNLSQFVPAQAAIEYVTLYFIDNTAQKWVKNDNAKMKAIDNSNGHDSYWMTQMDETTWSVKVPKSAYNITFNRYNADKTTQWNSYASSIADGRTIIPFEATIPVKNTGYDLTGNLEVGLACSGTVDFNILKYKMTVELIPSDYGSYKVNQITF